MKATFFKNSLVLIILNFSCQHFLGEKFMKTTEPKEFEKNITNRESYCPKKNIKKGMETGQ